MNFIMYKEIIFGATRARAEEKLKKIYEEEIKWSNDEFVIKRTPFSIKTNKRSITAVSTNQSCRGYRCSYAYVDVDVSIKHFNEVIKPCLYPYKRGNTLQESMEYFE